MTLSRRSFLTALAGAIGASAAAMVAPSFIPTDPRKFSIDGKPWITPFTIWDSLTIQPGEVVNARLLPPPVPSNFVIHRVGVNFNADALYESVSGCLDQVYLRLVKGELDLLKCPLAMLPHGFARFDCMPELAFSGQDLGVYFQSPKAASIATPVTVSVILDGQVQYV